jgi:PA14 domain/Bacterial SH3 domain
MMSRKIWIIIIALVALLSAAVFPAAAQTGIVWNGEFYNNTILQGPAVLSRQDTSIAFDWGNGSPGVAVNADNFSARWGTDPFFQTGTYRFWALADDKVRIYVDFNNAPIIDTFTSPAVAQIVAADLPISQGVHHVQVDYQEASGNAYVFVTWANLATNPTGPNFPSLTNSNPFPVSGPWTAQYYANTTLAGSPTLIQTETSPTHDWGTGSPVASLPADNFSARWTSVQTVPAGTYQLAVKADDGVRVTVDGVIYVNEFHQATGLTYNATLTLTAGQHSFLIDYYEAGGVAFLNFSFLPLNALPTATPVVTGATATVTGAYKLNVRNMPSAVGTTILTKINRNETYPVVGRNGRSTWWQLNVNGIIGWVNGSYVTVVNATGVLVTDGTVPLATATLNSCATAPTPRLIVGHLGRVTPGLPNNMRSQAGAGNALVGQIPPGGTFTVMSGPVCVAGSYWWQVNYNGLLGWTPEGGSGQYWLEPI